MLYNLLRSNSKHSQLVLTPVLRNSLMLLTSKSSSIGNLAKDFISFAFVETCQTRIRILKYVFIINVLKVLSIIEHKKNYELGKISFLLLIANGNILTQLYLIQQSSPDYFFPAIASSNKQIPAIREVA